MSMNRQDAEVLTARFLSRGGSIKKMPEAIATTIGEVVQYLKSQSVDVDIEPGSDGKFTCDGDVINVQALVRMANRLRRKQRRPQFDLSLRAH